ncbi:MarR family winged helix-turn-helix transcriptional regulator [Chakrabartyella piscis]|uniref:MarR family winged helix-turn-helix transcriptional regulator n=1 Tax=Chakrabartyella piscis TaxID=2918914 RepID=UPI002958D8AB|nr:MarR family transcriptional regulator [Chakrabartyella piscis]
MESLNDLEQSLDELQKRLQKIKKTSMAEDSFLHSGEFSVIKFIAHYHKRFDTAPTLVKISQVIGISGATATTLSDRLIKKGLVKKEGSLEDKRTKLLSLTEKGEEYLLSNKMRNKEMILKLMSSIGEEDTKELARILKKINQHLENES